MTRILIIALVLFIFFILNVVFLTIIYFIRRRMNQVATWLSVMGVVASSGIELRSDSEGGTSEYPAISYSYQVNGQAYQNGKIAPGPEIGGSGARKVVAKYPAGAQVMVFYNPQKPSDAVLEKNATSALRFFWLFLAIFDCVLCVILPVIWYSMGQ